MRLLEFECAKRLKAHSRAIPANLTTKSMGYVTDVSKYHNAGKWSMDLKILRFMFKNI